MGFALADPCWRILRLSCSGHHVSLGCPSARRVFAPPETGHEASLSMTAPLGGSSQIRDSTIRDGASRDYERSKTTVRGHPWSDVGTNVPLKQEHRRDCPKSRATKLRPRLHPDSVQAPRYTSRMFERWTRGVVRWRIAVLALWVMVTIIGLVEATHLSPLLSTSLDVPGSPSAQANHVLAREFHDNVEGSFAVVVPGIRGPADEGREVLARVRRAARAVPGAEVTQSRLVGKTLYANVDTPLSLKRAAAETGTLRVALRDNDVTGALVTGPPALQHDLTPILKSDLRRGEIVTIAVALVVLLLVLGLSWAVLLPYLIAAATTSMSLLLLYLLARSVTLVIYAPNIVELFGLGLSMDYSLLLIHRFRHESTRRRRNRRRGGHGDPQHRWKNDSLLRFRGDGRAGRAGDRAVALRALPCFRRHPGAGRWRRRDVHADTRAVVAVGPGRPSSRWRHQVVASL